MRFPALLAPVLFTTLVFAESARADEVDLGPPVPQERLNELRGGYDLPTGLSVAFGFERTVTINGQTVITQSVTIPDVSKITTDQLSQLATLTQGKTVQVGGTSGTTNNLTTPTAPTLTAPTAPTAPTPPTIPTTPLVTVPTVPDTPAVGTPTLPTTPTVAPTIAPTDNTALVPNGGTTIAPTTDIAVIPTAVTSITPNMGTLIIQNTLDGQTIQAMTTIHAAVNTLTLLHDIHFTQSLSDSLRLGGTP